MRSKPAATGLDRAWMLAIGARCRAMLLAAQGDVDGAAGRPKALARARPAADAVRTGPNPTPARPAPASHARRRPPRATLREALAIFERLGAPLWAEQARAELGRRRARPPGRADPDRAASRRARRVGHDEP